MDNIWEKALTILKAEVNEQIYNAWFIPIKQDSFEENTLTLSVPNKFFENWIRDKYISLVTAALFQASGREITVNFSIAEPVAPPAAPGVSVPSGEKKDPSSLDPGKKQDTIGWLKSMFGAGKTLPESQYREIGLNPQYTFEDFVVGPSNRFVHAACLAVSENPARNYNPLFIHGGVGLGKTHLLQAVGNYILRHHPKLKILFISSEEFTNQLIQAIRTKNTTNFRNMYRNVDVLLIDDIQFISGKEATQEEFFHTFNKLYDSHKQIILSSDRSPKEIPLLEERLVSRFAWGLIADIQIPDFETRIAILEKKSENESAPVPKDVLFFLAEKVKTNIREMEGALIRVVAYSKLTGNDLSVDLARAVLKDMITEEERKITISLIQEQTCDYFGISLSDIKSKKRTNAIAYPRQVAMYLSRILTDHSLPDIGNYFGGKDHTTVLHAYEKIKKELVNNPNTSSIIEKLTMRIKK